MRDVMVVVVRGADETRGCADAVQHDLAGGGSSLRLCGAVPRTSRTLRFAGDDVRRAARKQYDVADRELPCRPRDDANPARSGGDSMDARAGDERQVEPPRGARVNPLHDDAADAELLDDVGQRISFTHENESAREPRRSL